MAAVWETLLSKGKVLLSRIAGNYSSVILPKRTAFTYFKCFSFSPECVFRLHGPKKTSVLGVGQGPISLNVNNQCAKSRIRPFFSYSLQRPSLCNTQVNQQNFLQPPNITKVRTFPTLHQILRGKRRTKKRKQKVMVAATKESKILLGPQRKGVCVKVFVRKPKKPNSANRKCALVRLNNGQTIIAYIPGERASLQEHGVVLFEGGRVQDCPGVRYKIVRGKYDVN